MPFLALADVRQTIHHPLPLTALCNSASFQLVRFLNSSYGPCKGGKPPMMSAERRVGPNGELKANQLQLRQYQRPRLTAENLCPIKECAGSVFHLFSYLPDYLPDNLNNHCRLVFVDQVSALAGDEMAALRRKVRQFPLHLEPELFHCFD